MRCVSRGNVQRDTRTIALSEGTGRRCALALTTFSDIPYAVAWRDKDGTTRQDWPVAEAIENPPADGTVWPTELRHNAFFRRQGLSQAGGDETIGDLVALKQMLTSDPQVQT